MRIQSLARNIACMAAVTVCMGAQAQQAGTYEGTTSDGQPMNLIVVYDATLGQYNLSWLFTSITLRCPVSGEQLHGLGAGGTPIAPIEIDQATVQLRFRDFYLESTMTFTNATTVQGKVRGAVAQFLPGEFPPRRAESCQSLNLPFTATWVSPQTAPNSPLSANSSTASVVHSGKTLQLRLPAAAR